MSGFELNKIAAAILLASLIAMVAGTVVNILYKPNLHPKQRGYEVEVAADISDANQPQTQEAVLDIPALMAKANAENGANIVKKCVACHSLDKGGANKVGPNLWDIVNKQKGASDGYNYSAALLAKGGKWDYEDLFHFLHKPNKFIPGTKMSFAGLAKPSDVADVIEYLRLKVSDNPPALP